jgi:lipopolysaccharide/colanic/teichoic acid biosynthesis glycosyltransferase
MIDDTELAFPEVIRRRRPWAWNGLHLAGKRAVDLIGALILIVFLSPVLLAAALLVRWSSPGPVFFRQQRWGRAGSQFTCWKFRTMHAKQDRFVDPAVLRELQGQGILLKMQKDPRVTRVGAWLRQTSIDELPQLFNVVLGDMSLVGPSCAQSAARCVPELPACGRFRRANKMKPRCRWHTTIWPTYADSLSGPT